MRVKTRAKSHGYHQRIATRWAKARRAVSLLQWVAFSLLPLLMLTACHSPKGKSALQRFEFQSAHMGTLFSITLYAPDESAGRAAAKAAFRRIGGLEEIMSDYQADSELMRLCGQPVGKAVPVSAELFDVLQHAEKISRLSNGAFDVTIGPHVRLWRFARKRKVLPSPEQMEEARAAVGWQKLRLDSRARTVTLLAPNMRLDLGGIAKGYAADEALRVLKGRGMNRALVAASGDIALGNPPPGQKGWKVGISAIGSRSNEVSRTVLLRNAGVSTSGDTEQFIEIGGVRYSHILNPATGLGLTNRIQATVIAPDATSSDALATTVCILGPERGVTLVNALPGTAALVLTQKDGERQTVTSRRYERIINPGKGR